MRTSCAKFTLLADEISAITLRNSLCVIDGLIALADLNGKGRIMGLQENIATEPVSKLHLRKLIPVSPDTTLRSAVELMREEKLGCVVVVDDDQKPLGMFNENILRLVMLDHPGYLDETVSQHMVTNCPYATLADPISVVLDAMQMNNTRFICVVDEEGRAVALTGQKGLMEYVAEHYPGEVMVQRIELTPYAKRKREGA